MRGTKMVGNHLEKELCMCHTCKRTGVRECDPEAAEIRCTICGYCESNTKQEDFQPRGGLRDPEDQDD